MKNFLTWWRERRVNRLLVERAGLKLRIYAESAAQRVCLETIEKLGRTDEMLRQLGCSPDDRLVITRSK